jgi:hypothetical protein
VLVSAGQYWSVNEAENAEAYVAVGGGSGRKAAEQPAGEKGQEKDKVKEWERGEGIRLKNVLQYYKAGKTEVLCTFAVLHVVLLVCYVRPR